MRVAVLPYKGVSRGCYEQLISTAFELARDAQMQALARWDWGRFSRWLMAHPFQIDDGKAKPAECATACEPWQRMRRFPPTMNCWERVLHQLAWFAARGAERATVYDHDTLIGRHIEVLVPPTTYLGAIDGNPPRAPANSDLDSGLAGLFGGLQGGVAGAGMGAAAGPYGALAGFVLGAGVGAVQAVMGAEAKKNAARAPPSSEPKAMPDLLVEKVAPLRPVPTEPKRAKARTNAKKSRNRNRK